MMNKNNHISQYKANKIDEFLGVIFFSSLCLTVYFYNALEAVFVLLAVISAIRYQNLLSFLRSNDAVSLFFWLLVLYSSFFLFRSLWGEYSHFSYNISFLVNNVIAFFVAVLVARFPMDGVQRNNVGYFLFILLFVFGAFWFVAFYLFALDSSFMLPHGRLQFFQGKSPFGPAFIFWGLILWYLSGLASSGSLKLKTVLFLIFAAIVYVNLFVNSRGATLGLILSVIYLALSFEGSWRRLILVVSGFAFMVSLLLAYFISLSDLDGPRSLFMASNFSDQKSATAIYIFVAILFYSLNIGIKKNVVFLAVGVGIIIVIAVCLIVPDTVVKFIEPYQHLDGRLPLWSAAIAQLQDLPIFGYGRNYEFEVVTLIYPFVHSQYLSWLLEGGILALVVGLIFVFGVFVKCFCSRGSIVTPFYGAFLLMWAVIIFFDGFMSMRGYLNIFIMQSVLFLSISVGDDPALKKI
jgi:hypothetical protein